MADDPHALRPGVSIAGYNIVRVLGAGGFGITYEAESPFTAQRVAIKEFFPRGMSARGNGADVVYSAHDADVVEWALKNFQSSALAQCRLKHPSIINVIHYVKENNTGYMIMDYVEGDTLEHWLREREFLPAPEELQPLFAPVLSALEYLHERKIIHRDIAPDNIMVRTDGTPLLIDFGSIKLIARETQLRSNAQTYAVMKQYYSPPEQMQDKAVLDPRADIYSIGAVIYRALSGAPPENARERMEKLAYGHPDPYVPLAERASLVTPGFAAAIDRALSFNADERHAEIAELREELGWPEASGVPTFVIPRDDGVEPAPRRSALPWLLPLFGIAAIGAVVAYSNGFIALPKFSTEIAKVSEPAPKLDDVKEIPQVPVHTQPDANVPKQETADGYMVVVASHKTEEEAQAALASLKTQLPSLFADHDTDVIGVNVGASDAFYRAMVGPLIKEDADALCQEFKRNNVACLVRMDN